MSVTITPAAARTLAALCNCSLKLAATPDREQEFFRLHIADYVFYRASSPAPATTLALNDPRGIGRATIKVGPAGELDLQSNACRFTGQNIVAAEALLAAATTCKHRPAYLTVLHQGLKLAVSRHASTP